MTVAAACDCCVVFRPRAQRLFNPKNTDGSANPEFSQWPTPEECQSIVGARGRNPIRTMLRSGLVLSVGVDSGWIPHFGVACAFFVPMIFQTSGQDCEGAGCSYHMVLLQRLLPLPHFLMQLDEYVWTMFVSVLLIPFLFKEPIMKCYHGKMTVRSAIDAIEDPARCFVLLYYTAKFLKSSKAGFSIGISHFMKNFSANMTNSMIPDQHVNPDDAYASPSSSARAVFTTGFWH